jgi:hypothetical protein
VRAIVHDFGVGVNEYAAFGRDVPFWKPECCPLCGGLTLEGHGVRSRVGWTGATAVGMFVRRLKCPGCPRTLCAANSTAKSATFTVLPNFAHPHKRYLLADIDGVIQERYLGDRSFLALATATPPGGPCPSTQQEWCQGFSRAAPLWLPILLAWLVPRKPTALVRSVSRDAAVGLLAIAVRAVSVWGPSLSATPGQVLVPLWSWGGTRRLPALLPPIRRTVTIRGPTCVQSGAILIPSQS